MCRAASFRECTCTYVVCIRRATRKMSWMNTIQRTSSSFNYTHTRATSSSFSPHGCAWNVVRRAPHNNIWCLVLFKHLAHQRRARENILHTNKQKIPIGTMDNTIYGWNELYSYAPYMRRCTRIPRTYLPHIWCVVHVFIAWRFREEGRQMCVQP